MAAGLIPVLSANSTFVGHAGTVGQVGGFEVDGDFGFPRIPPIAGATRDWVTIGGVSRGDDAANSGTDDVFGGGAKEQTPDTWTFDSGPKPPGKDDLTRVYGATAVTATDAYLFIGFERLDIQGTGDAHANFEFNQKTSTVTNGSGTAIPERTAGDLLVVYDFDGGGKTATVEVRTWSGTALSGSWDSMTLPGGAVLGDVNALPVPRPAFSPFGGGIIEPLRFGEAALNLGAIFGSQFPGCPGFAQFSVKTRASGESFNSQLKDRSEPVPLTLARCPDVHIAKSPATQTVDAGETVSFTLTGTNDGIAEATDVVVTDDLLNSLSDVSATYDVDPNTPGGTGVCTVGAGKTVRCAVGVLAASDGNATGPEPDTVLVTITARTTPVSCGVRTNRALIQAGAEALADRDDNVSDAVTFTVRCPDVRVLKSTTTPTVSAGETISYDIVVENLGNGAATGVTLRDALPSGFTWRVVPSVDECAIASGTLSCSFAGMAAGAQVTIHLESPTGPGDCGLHDNEVTALAANEPSSALGNNSAGPVGIAVECADIDIDKTADASVVSAGTPIGFTLSVTNQGSGTATGVVVTDSLPGAPGLSWSVDGGTAAGTCAISSGVLTCSIGSLAGGATATVHLISPTTPAGCGTVVNTADVTTTNDGRGSAQASVRIDCPSVRISKTADDPWVSAGDDIGFTVTVVNDGPGSATGVRLTDDLPGTFDWAVSPAVTGCSIASGTLSCDIGTMSAGDGFTVHVTATSDADDCAVYDNVAGASSSNGESVFARATTEVRCARINLVKIEDTPTVNAGDDIGFLLVVTNTGEGEARGVTVTDVLPVNPGLSWTIDGGSAADACSILAGTMTCDLGTMAPGAEMSVHITSPTNGLSCGPVVNVASVTTSNDGSAQASATTVVNCPLGIAIVKEGPDLAHRGDTIEYTMAVITTSLTPLAQVAVTDPLCDEAPALQLGDDGDGLLEVGETWVWSCTHVIASDSPDPLPNTASATGIGNGETVTASDDHLVDLIAPAINIDKTVGPVSGTIGTPVTYTYVVTNTGDTTLFDVEVTDDILGPIGTIGVLAAGSKATLTRGAVLGAASVTNIGVASGEDVLGLRVTDSDPATVTVVAGVRLVRTGSGTAGWLLGVLAIMGGGVMIALGRRKGRRASA